MLIDIRVQSKLNAYTMVVPDGISRRWADSLSLEFGNRRSDVSVVRGSTRPMSERMDRDSPYKCFVSRETQSDLRLPTPCVLHLKSDGSRLTLGPSLGIYIHDTGDRLSPFGEQTGLLKELIEFGKSRGVDVVVLTPRCLSNQSGFRYDVRARKWIKTRVPYPDIVLRRSGNFFKLEAVAKRELDALKANGRLFTLPRVCSNKWSLYQALHNCANIVPYLPLTTQAKSAAEVYESLRRRTDVYIKPLAASQGASVYHLKWDHRQVVASWEEPTRLQGEKPQSNSGPKSVEERRYQNFDEFSEFWKKTRLVRCIVQDTVQLVRTRDGRPFDFRWLIQHDGFDFIVRARVARVGQPRSVTTNIHTGAVAMDAGEALEQAGWTQTTESLRQMDRAALSVAHRLAERYGNFVEVGVDLAMQSDGSIRVFEVNPTPGRKMLRQVSNEIREMSLISLLEYAIRATGFDNGH